MCNNLSQVLRTVEFTREMASISYKAVKLIPKQVTCFTCAWPHTLHSGSQCPTFCRQSQRQDAPSVSYKDGDKAIRLRCCGMFPLELLTCCDRTTNHIINYEKSFYYCYHTIHCTICIPVTDPVASNKFHCHKSNTTCLNSMILSTYFTRESVQYSLL